MYSLDDYGQMIADDARTVGYAKAIARAVRPGDVVLDIGCGVGTFSLLACRAGARRVYAIESEDIIQWGRQLAAANGFSDRIEFLQADSRQVQLPERAGVLICDLRGALPFFGDAIASVEDARQRLLVPNARMIPQRDVLFAALVEAPETYERISCPWREERYGLDFSSVRSSALSATFQGAFAGKNVLTPAERWSTLDFTADAKPNAAASVVFRAVREGMAHGIALWFDTDLFEDIGFSTSPLLPETVYGRFMLPLLQPLELRTGDQVLVELRADPVGDTYVWRWETKFVADNGRTDAHFRQSTFQSATLSSTGLQRRSAEFLPQLSALGEAQAMMLKSMDGKTSLEQIAHNAAAQFPHAFRDTDEAFRFASSLSAKFAK